MSLPISKKQLNKLGERIAAARPPEKRDLQLFNEVLRAYQAILGRVEDQLSLIGLAATTRVKTKSVLIEKLQREHGMALARVQDLAGARTVIEGGWAEQDIVVDQLVAHFDAWTGNRSKISDRRVTPSHGYRAVHVIVFPEGVPVEIQVRTELQNYWAQIIERLADRWGRGIRYGEDPEDAHLPAEGVRYPDGSPVPRQRVIDDLRIIADQVAAMEETERALEQRPQAPTLERRIVDSFGREVDDLDSDARLFYPSFRAAFKRAIERLAWSGILPQAMPRNRHTRPVDRRRIGRLIRRTLPDSEPADAEEVRMKLLSCDAVVETVVNEQQSRLKQQQANLRVTLQGLGEYVEQGGIR